MKKIITLVMMAIILINTMGLSVVATETAWYTGWSMHNASVVEGSDVICMSSIGVTPGEGSSNITSSISVSKPANLGNQFDLSITLRVNQYGGNEHLVFATGSGYKAVVYIEEGSFAGFPFDTGYEEHTFRMLGEGNVAEIYADGAFLGLLPLREDDGGARIYFQFTHQKNISAEMLIHDVTFLPFSGSQISEQDIAPEKRSVFCDFETDAGGWVSSDGSWFLKDGTWRVENTNSAENYAASTEFSPIIYVGENFRAEFEMMITGISHQQSFNIFWPGYQFTFRPRPTYFEYIATKNTVTEYAGDLMDGEFHQVVIETSNGGRDVSLMVDGKLLVDEPAKAVSSVESSISASVQSQGGKLSGIVLDSFSLDIIQEKLVIESVEEGSVYLEGSDIVLSSKTSYLDEKPELVEYSMGGEVVATGVAPDYNAIISNLRPGSYEIIATANDGRLFSSAIPFEVVSDDGENLIASVTEDVLTASLTGYSGADCVEYFLDGQPIGESSLSPYEISCSGIMYGNHTVLALCRDSAGVVRDAFSKNLNAVGSGVSVNYANEISYLVTDNASIDFSNGNHRLSLSHTADGVTYLTDTGEEFYDMGAGKFEIITDGAVADVYRNGQMVFSYYMPRTELRNQTVSGAVDYRVSVPEWKKTYFIKRDVIDQGMAYELGEIPIYHNLDFVADSNDEANLVINDGYYLSDILLQNGKFYILTGTLKDAGSIPEYTYLADAMDGEVFYRVETAFGMCRLYGNGRFLTSYQAVPGGGTGSLYVQVQKGELSYVEVNDNNDLRLFSDTFDGEGAVSSDQFWQDANMEISLDKDAGTISVSPMSGEEGIIEWNAFATDFDFDATVELEEDAGCFWVILNHTLKKSYTKIGYNFESGKYEGYWVNENTTTKIAQSAFAEFPSGATTISLRARRKGEVQEVVLFVEEEPVLAIDNKNPHAGTFGFLIQDNCAVISHVAYRGDAMMVQGLVNNEYKKEEGMIRTGDMVVLNENEFFFMQRNSVTRDYTFDGGKTWEKVAGTRQGDNYNCIRLSSGELLGTILEGYNVNTKAYRVYQSNDNGDTWNAIGWMQEPEKAFYSGQNRMMQTDYGRIFFVAAKGQGDESSGTSHSVYYSDNNGQSWQESNNAIDPKEVGMVVDEAVIVQASDMVMHCYFRTDRGFICYVESHDKGVTWNTETVYRTPFSSAANCFNVERDMDTGVLYMTWGYDNANLCGMIQLPRTRWAVAKSEDNGDTWEFMGTGHENNRRTGSTMMNLSINVAPNHLILSGYSTVSGSSNVDGARRVSVSKNQVASKRFDRLHHCEEELIRPYLEEEDSAKALVIPKAIKEDRWVDPAAYPDGVDYLPQYVWYEDFSDGDADNIKKPADATMEFVVENGAMHGQASAEASSGMQYTDSGFSCLEGKDFSFSYKVKVSETSDLSFIDSQTSFGSESRLRVTIGHMNMDFQNLKWHEILYVYRYDEELEDHVISVYYRVEGDNGWSTWTLLADGLTETQTNANYSYGFRIYLPRTPGNLNNANATDIWVDDFKVYLHEPVLKQALVNGYRVDGVTDGAWVSVDVAASWLGANTTELADGSIVFARGDSKVTFLKETLWETNGKRMVNVDDLAEKYGLTITEHDGVFIVSDKDSWTGRCKGVFSRELRSGDVFAGEITPSGRVHHLVEESFVDEWAPNYILGETSSLKEQMLCLEPTESFVMEDIVIPVGGYADFVIENNDAWQLSVSDGEREIFLEKPSMQSGKWITCRVVRNHENLYDVYIKGEEEIRWIRKIADTFSTSQNGTTGFSLKNTGEESALHMDGIHVYGPSSEMSMVVVDGATTNLISQGEFSSLGGNLRVLLSPDHTENQEGFVAGYGANGTLLSLENFSVLADDKEKGYNTKLLDDERIKTVKIFVWSGYEDGVPYYPAYTVKRK